MFLCAFNAICYSFTFLVVAAGIEFESSDAPFERRLSRMNQKGSCGHYNSFKRLTEEGSPITDPCKIEGVEFTLGTCTECGQYLMHCWVGSGIASAEVTVDSAFVDELKATEDEPARM